MINCKNNEEFSNYITTEYLTTAFRRNEINLFNIVPNVISFIDELECGRFSEIYRYLKSNYTAPLIRTKSKGISLKRENIDKNVYSWYIDERTSNIEFVISLFSEDLLKQHVYDSKTYIFARFIIGIRTSGVGKSKMPGRIAYCKLLEEFKKDGIDLADYATTKGLEIKQTIKSPLIDLIDAQPGITYENAHHLDLNSAYASKISEAKPELKATYERLYNNRKLYPEYKDILNMSIGFMQSKYCIIYGKPYALATLSKIAIDCCHDEIEYYTKKLQDSGRKILARNTDGIWYQGDIYHDEKEGNYLGNWKNDHIGCLWRCKSEGSYEYIENGKYFPVVRGCTTYEKIVKRENWIWGDIFKGVEINFTWDENLGLIKKE